MLYTELTIKGNAYKLRLDARTSVALERKLGKSPLAIFSTIDGMPKLEEMIEVFAASLNKYQHGLTLDSAYDLYDDYIEEGNSFTDFIPVIIEIYKASGFFKEEEVKEEEIKN